MSSDALTVIGMTYPTIAVLIGILLNNSRLSDLRSDTNKRFDDVNIRFAGVNARFDAVNLHFDDVNRRFDDVNRRLDEMRVEIRDLIRLTSERHDANLKRFQS